MTFREAVQGLLAGDFSRLEPQFLAPPGGPACPILAWHEEGLFAGEPTALAEAFTCACFNGCNEVVEQLLTSGLNPDGGMATGFSAFHWAANRGQLETVKILLRAKASLEIENSYGGTVLGCAVWSAIHEPRPDHIRIIEALLDGGARVSGAHFPSGDPRVDHLLTRASRP